MELLHVDETEVCSCYPVLFVAACVEMAEASWEGKNQVPGSVIPHF